MLDLKSRAPSLRICLLEEQLADGREWVMVTESPGLANIATHVIYNWMWYLKFLSLSDLFDAQVFPNSVASLTRMRNHLAYLEKNNVAASEKMTGDGASKLIVSSSSEDDTVGFDDTEAGRLRVTRGDIVSVTPSDHGELIGTSA